MKCKGKSVFEGVAIGKIIVLNKEEMKVRRYKISDIYTEKLRLAKAIEQSINELKELYQKALSEAGKDSAEIFEVHQMMLEDDDYVQSINYIIENESLNAEYAVATTSDNFVLMFESMDDDYMKARAADIKDISNRIISVLCDSKGMNISTCEPVIIAAEDLSPSETVQLDKSKILAFITVHGSTNSHTAILARTMNIPALIGVDIDLKDIHDGDSAIVDSENEYVILNPTEIETKEAESRIQNNNRQKELLESLKGMSSETKSGKKINLYANISGVGDVGYVLENDAEGIGLFRSEFLYIGREALPSEEEQLQAYRHVLQMMAGKKVIIRTMDIGADKQADYLGIGDESNPAMGYRAIRICLKQPDIFITQLRALFRASIYGNLSIMYPMITSVWEVERIHEIIEKVKKELNEEGIRYSVPEQGIMIETPAAVMISDELAELVDFFSIGTNDLTQYTLAIDRQNERLDDFYNSSHTAVIKMIRYTIEQAHKKGIWVGICGELGNDTSLTGDFIEMGIDELSVAPSMILKMRDTIRKIK